MRRERKSLRNGVHHANAVVWGPVYRTRLRLSRERPTELGRNVRVLVRRQHDQLCDVDARGRTIGQCIDDVSNLESKLLKDRRSRRERGRVGTSVITTGTRSPSVAAASAAHSSRKYDGGHRCIAKLHTTTRHRLPSRTPPHAMSSKLHG
mgnify:CR=1 FL=1